MGRGMKELEKLKCLSLKAPEVTSKIIAITEEIGKNR